ncbi:type I-C CRISPR-associated protein Cas7/Csd2 [Candidatus Brocadia sapporoensis]|uniref:Type I-C CRISPR-associated protein Cas7/Csd2 n=1 Tax=Candidatus Brocadia sapporoensis TaxID=392547 RepID=A0A1V6M0T3_9BACT|nr:type I-C CRISPR-associated protein Cas7/Csd2 [Candidatus Brocadia sapporoensis]OQD45990.1 type I-C CRISPR-associated protein Cas7/Csd2 [Candidatus Brocadia sapporoensis]GJQ23436.1 MAG: type I-C CRISPR-associated protein Cas7/Csd2 [Candidatus Brocadia sapporoensis]
MNDPINNRYDFVLFFDVKDGNPNGDPDAGNLPRVDPETGHGLVTDVCIKRKVRNYVQLEKGGTNGYDIFIKERAILNKYIREGYEALGINLNEPPIDKKDGEKRKTKGGAQGGEIEKGRQYMCRTYYDIRTFGAVLSTGANAGQVRGPIQITFARSVDQVVPLEHSLTVCAARSEDKSIEEQIGIQGRKFTIPYGLYRSHGFISAPFAAQTGFNQNDLDLFWKALVDMFEHDRSAARGQMATRKLIVFKHESAMGNASAHKLFDLVKAEATTNPVRDFSNYTITVPTQSEVDEIAGKSENNVSKVAIEVKL